MIGIDVASIVLYTLMNGDEAIHTDGRTAVEYV